MPARVAVALTPQVELPLSELTPDRLHGLFYSVVGGELAQELHRPSRVKPFSLGFSVRLKGGERCPVPCGDREGTVERILLRVSFLSEDLFPKFLSSFMLSEGDDLRLGEVPLRKTKKPLIRESDLRSYRTIFEKAETTPRIGFEFLTPTSFKRGETDYPLPDPTLIFKGLIRKWQRFSDLRIETDLREAVERRIQVSAVRIRSRKVVLSDLGKITGYTGRVTLFVDDRDPAVLKWINALGEFAEFAGIGRKTTMGFGVVRFSKPESDQLPEGGVEE